MKVQFLDVKREWKFFEKSFLRAFIKFGRGGRYVLGPEVEIFEKEFAGYCGYKYAVGVSTGLSALEMALRAYKVGTGDEVITVPNSAVATSLAISNVGATPVFCDINEDYLIDTGKIEKLITKRTKAILPVHLFGKVCDMRTINRLARKYKLSVIEDACQAHGATFSGESAMCAKAFSFYPTKNLGALGEGGAVVTNDEKIRDFVLSYRNYGQQGRYNHVLKGTNGRIDTIQCALMNVKLKKLDQFVDKRRKITKLYLEAFQNIKGLRVNKFDPKSAQHLFVIRVLNNRRDALKIYLQKKGVETLVHYPVAIHRQPCYQKEYKNIKLPVTDQLQHEILSLPCNPLLSAREIATVITTVKSFFGAL